jgi:hypothetical protein
MKSTRAQRELRVWRGVDAWLETSRVGRGAAQWVELRGGGGGGLDMSDGPADGPLW